MGGCATTHRGLSMPQVLLSASPHCEARLFNLPFNGYSFNDMLTSRWFRHSSSGMTSHMKQWPHSLLVRWLRAVHARWSRHNETLINISQRSPPAAVAELMRSECRERSSGYPQWCLSSYRRSRRGGLAAVHLRVGDVLDLSSQSLHMVLCHGGGSRIEWM